LERLSPVRAISGRAASARSDDGDGAVIFVTPNAAFTADIGGLLRHELSHAVLNQNRSLLSVLRMLRQPWVSEGVAGS